MIYLLHYKSIAIYVSLPFILIDKYTNHYVLQSKNLSFKYILEIIEATSLLGAYLCFKYRMGFLFITIWDKYLTLKTIKFYKLVYILSQTTGFDAT